MATKLTSEYTLGNAHRFARQAETAEASGNWTQAIDKHFRAAKNFQECVGVTHNPEANQALLLLVNNHKRHATRIQQLLGFDDAVDRAAQARGYHAQTIDETLLTTMTEGVQSLRTPFDLMCTKLDNLRQAASGTDAVAASYICVTQGTSLQPVQRRGGESLRRENDQLWKIIQQFLEEYDSKFSRVRKTLDEAEEAAQEQNQHKRTKHELDTELEDRLTNAHANASEMHAEIKKKRGRIKELHAANMKYNKAYGEMQKKLQQYKHFLGWAQKHNPKIVSQWKADSARKPPAAKPPKRHLSPQIPLPRR